MPEFYVEPLTDRWTCFKCNKAATGKKKLFKCAGCEAITYCSVECQRQDWARHKYNCVPVMVTEIPGKGRGLVAARDIKKGELIFEDKDAIKLRVIRDARTKNVLVDTVDEEFVKSLKEQFENFPAEAKLLFLQLQTSRDTGDFYPFLARRCFSASDINLVRLFLDNSKHNPFVKDSAVLRLNTELVNHSCSPNAVDDREADEDKGAELRAIRDICKGEEVTICYFVNFKQFGSISRKRKTAIKKVAGFDCKCPVCLGKVPGQDKMMKKLIELHTKSGPNPSDWTREVRIRDKIVDLFLDLEIGPPHDKHEALAKLVKAAQLASDPTLLKKAMDKCKKAAEDTKLKSIEQYCENMERLLAQGSKR